MASRRFHCLRMSTYGRPVSGFAWIGPEAFAGRIESRYSTSSRAIGPRALMPLFTFLCWSSLKLPRMVDAPSVISSQSSCRLFSGRMSV